jgi:hypothetical protein
MIKFLLGVVFTIVVGAIFAIAISFEWFKAPVPVDGPLLHKMWMSHYEDSTARWVLVGQTETDYAINLEYPIKRYKFLVPRHDIVLRIKTSLLPVTIRSEDISLTSDPDHTFAR